MASTKLRGTRCHFGFTGTVDARILGELSNDRETNM